MLPVGRMCYRARNGPKQRVNRAAPDGWSKRGRWSAMAAVTVPSERIDAGAPKAASGQCHPGGRRHRQALRDAGRRAHRGRSCLAQRRAGRVPGRDRPLGLRQIDPVQRDRRAARRLRGHGQGRGRAGERAACVDRHDLPGGVDLSLAQRDRQCRVPAGDRRPAEGRALRARAAFREARRARRVRAALSGRAVGRHAPARVDGAHAGGASRKSC